MEETKRDKAPDGREGEREMREEKSREDPRKEIRSPEPPEAEPLPDRDLEEAAGGHRPVVPPRLA